jgi:hypothetical protein
MSAPSSLHDAFSASHMSGESQSFDAENLRAHRSLYRVRGDGSR